ECRRWSSRVPLPDPRGYSGPSTARSSSPAQAVWESLLGSKWTRWDSRRLSRSRKTAIFPCGAPSRPPLRADDRSMTPEHARLVRAGWRRFEPFAKDWAVVFYRRLSELHPGSRALFSVADMPVLQHKFGHMLGWMVQSLGNPERLVSEVARLGRRHQ